jgi:formate dehydrogenase subunit delta
MMSNLERLAYMADQIGRNFAPLGDAGAASATANHIARYWDPRMKEQGFAMLDGEGPALTPVAAAALRLLRDRSAATA